ncbi:hypothetical protein PHLCEN_2v3384 [Hermanssonia centrifuga]|uniref:DUF7702 domain-containing protein n=1 Tax=Hermanssonia centrifuga TaxID=98765 RepID=A0A2R6QIU7_9APHY|nr:hypothetical protein PHLCEN_2v3384 [Hermanssonia centrifuga]
MGLDARGDTSVVELIVYIPLVFVSLFLLFKHGFGRAEGWIYLLIFSIIRIVGAGAHISWEGTRTPGATSHTIYLVMESSGVSPLLSATLGFLTTIGQYAFDDEARLRLLLRVVKIASTVALALAISGGVAAASDTELSKINNGLKMRHIGVIIFAIVLLLITLVHVYYWMNKERIMKHRRNLLLAISFSVPFLAVRVLYTVLSSFAPTGIPGVTSGSASLAAFSSTTGNFVVYLIMSVIMEFIVIIIYVTAGMKTPLQQDCISAKTEVTWQDEEHGARMYPPNSAYAPSSSDWPVRR